MTEELREKLAALRQVAPKLNKATDEANRIVASVENLLGNELSLGISATVCFNTGEEIYLFREVEEVLDVYTNLDYGRIDGRYRIFVRTYGSLPDEYGQDKLRWSDQTIWSSVPRELKLKAFEALPRLLTKIADTALELSKEAEDTAKTVEALMRAIKPASIAPDSGESGIESVGDSSPSVPSAVVSNDSPLRRRRIR